MYAIHQTLLPSSAINFTLFLQHFTPSTIYPIPKPSSSRVQLEDVQVVGNLVVAGGADLRVFEVRESKVPVVDGASDGEAEEEVKGEYGDSYLESGPAKVCIPCQVTGRLDNGYFARTDCIASAPDIYDSAIIAPRGFASGTRHNHRPCPIKDD